MKATMYTKYATRSLARGGQRTVFAIFCVAIGVLAIVALQLVGNMIEASLSDNIRAANGGDIAVHTELHDITDQQLAYFAALKAQGAITDYTASVSSSATISTTTSGFQRFGFETVDPNRFPLGGSLQFVTPGNGSLATLLTGNTVVATSLLAQQLNLHVGQTLIITTDEGRSGAITIGGIIENTGFLAGRPDMLISQQTYEVLPSLSGAPIGYTWVWVNVPGHSDAAATHVAAQIQRQFPLVTTTTVKEAEDATQTEIQDIRYFLQIIGLLALLIGGVGIINTMQVLLRRRQLEIAMLKTTGYRQRDLTVMFGLEAVLLGFGGGVIGAAGGIGMSLLIKHFAERAFFFTLPTLIDPLTVASGVVIGVATTLIFGLLPIIQASQIRPLAVLREVRESGGIRQALSSAPLIGVFGMLFFLLALSILRNPLIALAVVAGSGLLLFLLTFFFAGLAWLISRLPVLDTLRWWYALLLVLALLVAAGVTWLSPGFGVLLLLLVLSGIVVVTLPRGAKANIRLALRNVGRQKIRNATTLVALFSGVFAIGLGLALGQGLTNAISQIANTKIQYNAFVLSNSRDKATVDQQLAHASGLTQELVTMATPDEVVAVNGVPIATLSPNSSLQGAAASGALGTSVSGVDGVDLASGSIPSITLEQGLQDSHKGRTLTAADAATTNALMPLNDSQAPLKLKLGDAVTVTGLSRKTTITLHVVGFYTNSSLAGVAPVFADQHVVSALSGGNPYYVYALHLDQATADRTLQLIKQAAPSTITVSVGAIVQQIDDLLANVVALIETIASLAMLAGVVMIANAVALAILERRREMGILKAVGHTSRSVLGSVLVENGVLGVAGAFLAMLLVTFFDAMLGSTIFRFGRRISAFGVSPALVIALVAATAAICVLVAGSVAWRATRVRPLEVLRYE